MVFQKRPAMALFACFCIFTLTLSLVLPLPVLADIGITVNQGTTYVEENLFYGHMSGAGPGSLMLLQSNGNNNEFRVSNDGSVNMYSNALTTTGSIRSASYCDDAGANCFTAAGVSAGGDGYIGDAVTHTSGGSLIVDNNNDDGTTAFWSTRTGGTTQGIKIYANDRNLYTRYIEDAGESSPGTWRFINELSGGSSYEFMTARNNGNVTFTAGNVGIGDTSPDQKLTINSGNISLTSGNYIMLNGESDTNWRLGRNMSALTTSLVSSDHIELVAYPAADQGVAIGPAGGNSVMELNNQNVYIRGSLGIGSASPGARLHVNDGALLGNTYVQPTGSIFSSASQSQIALSGSHNAGYNTGDNKAKLLITGYDNDDSTDIYPIFVEDENGNVDFWLKNRQGASSNPTAYFAGSIGVGTNSVCTTCTKIQVEGAATGVTAYGSVWGVQGYAENGGGVQGRSDTGEGVWAESDSGYDIWANGPKSYLHGPVGIGITPSSYQLYVVDETPTSDSPAIYGRHDIDDYYGLGVLGIGGYKGVRGEVTGTADRYYYGVEGSASGGAAGATVYGVRGYAGGSGTRYGVYGSGGTYNFYAGGSGTDYGTFTGAHECRLASGFGEVEPGMLVSLTGNVEFREDSISATIPEIRLSDSAEDKNVLGVLVSEVPFGGEWKEFPEDVRFASVNALGEGRLWVTNYGGELELGDYITTSPIAGYGMIQNDDLTHNYTAGKVTQNIDWDSITDTVWFEGQEYKKALITVIYLGG